jgi:hypothetical protein
MKEALTPREIQELKDWYELFLTEEGSFEGVQARQEAVKVHFQQLDKEILPRWLEHLGLEAVARGVRSAQWLAEHHLAKPEASTPGALRDSAGAFDAVLRGTRYQAQSQQRLLAEGAWVTAWVEQPFFEDRYIEQVEEALRITIVSLSMLRSSHPDRTSVSGFPVIALGCAPSDRRVELQTDNGMESTTLETALSSVAVLPEGQERWIRGHIRGHKNASRITPAVARLALSYMKHEASR